MKKMTPISDIHTYLIRLKASDNETKQHFFKFLKDRENHGYFYEVLGEYNDGKEWYITPENLVNKFGINKALDIMLNISDYDVMNVPSIVDMNTGEVREFLMIDEETGLKKYLKNKLEKEV